MGTGRTLVLGIRHLETEDNREQRFSSGDRDVSIVPDQQISEDILESLKRIEREQSKLVTLGYKGRRRGDSGLVVVDTGLNRSMQTARLLVSSLYAGRELVIIPGFSDFRERIGGQLAGLQFSELQQIFPELRSPNEFWGVEAPDMGLEPATVFLSRIKNGITRLNLMLYRGSYPAVVIVAHAGSLKGMKAVLTTEDTDERKQILCEPTPHHDLFQFSIENDMVEFWARDEGYIW